MSDFLYPLDTTGSALSNRVRGELQTLSPPTQSDNFHFIIPKAGPYYRDTVILTHTTTNRKLVRGIDWEPAHYFISASNETENVKGGIYQSILFLDRTLSGQIQIDEYFVLGDHWSLDENKVLEILSNRLWDPRVISYEQVSGKPEVFPPIAHMHPSGDLIGMREQVEGTLQVAAAIRAQTDELPGKLALTLEDYYSSRDVDDLLEGISAALIASVAGPELEVALRVIVEQMIGNYYTKSEVDSRLNTITNLINARYTNAVIEQKLAGKVDRTEYQSTIAEFVTHTLFSSTIDEIRSGLITQTHLTNLQNSLSLVDQDLQRQINALLSTLEDVGMDLSGFLKTSEFDGVLNSSTIITTIRNNITAVNDALTTYRNNTNPRLDSLEADMRYKIEESDVYRILSNQTLDIDDSIFAPLSIMRLGQDENGELVPLYDLDAAITWQTQEGNDYSGMEIVTSVEHTIYYFHQGTQHTTLLPPGTYPVFNSTSSDPADVKYVTLSIIPGTAWFEFNMSDTFIPSGISNAPVYAWVRSGVGSQPLNTDPTYNEVVEIDRNLTAAELTASTITIPLTPALAVRFVNRLGQISLMCNGEYLPVAGYHLDVEQPIRSNLVIMKPSFNIASVPAAQRNVRLKATVEVALIK